MALDLTTALNQYGFVGSLANAVPELKAIFAQAAREEWPPAQFDRAVMDSSWYKQNAESVRYYATLAASDPATYNQDVGNAAAKVRAVMNELGLTSSGVAGADTNKIALAALTGNWDDQQLRTHLARTMNLNEGPLGSLYGDAAELEKHMRGLATNYGVPYTDAWIKSQVRAVQTGYGDLNAFESLMRARAKAAFPQFADQLDGGMTLRDIADPYISTMANTLEVSETQIPLDDRWVKQAMSSKQADGTVGAMPLWEFERKLKDDPRWDKTKQARTQAFDTLAEVGRDFGFVA